MMGMPGEAPLRLAVLGDPRSRHTQRWMGAFLDLGFDVHLLVPVHDQVPHGLDPRVGVHRFTAWPRTRIRGLGSLVTAASLRSNLRAIAPDVLHAHALNRYGVASWLSGFHPRVITVWGSDVLVVMRQTRHLRIHARLALGSADLVTGGSRELIRAAIESGARPERVAYVHFGVDTDRFAPGPDPSGLRERLGLVGRRVILSNRTIDPLYRHRVVVDALARLPDDTVMLMTSHLARDHEVEVVLRQAAELGLGDRVRIAPELDDAEMPDLYRLADVVVSVPVTDGGPTTVAEALAVGKPVVATDLPSVREWLAELDPQSLVPVDDADATAAAIRRSLERPAALTHEIGMQGRRAVEQRASQRANMARMAGLYRQLADRQRGAVTTGAGDVA